MSEPTPVTLYRFVPFDRSGRVRWLLEELGHPYEDRDVDYQAGETKTPEFLAKSPGGKVPALVDGDTVLFETGAALQYLAETYGGDIAPGPGDRCRGAYLSWMFYASATVDPVVFEFLRPDMPEELRPARRERAKLEVVRMLDAYERQLGDKETFLARGFTPVDIQVTCTLDYARVGGCLEGREALGAYLERMKARPAVKAAQTFRG